MLTPKGHSADKIDKVMLLAMWAKQLAEEQRTIITAGMGKPTYPVNLYTVASYKAHWENVELLAKMALEHLNEVKEGAAIDYGDPRGDVLYRRLMATAMSDWYNSPIEQNEVLFTTGGAGALRVIFEALHKRYEHIPGYRVITPFPHYSLYSNNSLHRLHPIDVMKEPGYRLTAQAIEESIESAYHLAETDKGVPKAILICNPSNPLGSVISKEEFLKNSGSFASSSRVAYYF